MSNCNTRRIDYLLKQGQLCTELIALGLDTGSFKVSRKFVLVQIFDILIQENNRASPLQLRLNGNSDAKLTFYSSMPFGGNHS